MTPPIRVIIVDDSAPIREMFRHFLSEDPMIEVVAVAEDPLDAREKIKQLHPDVMTLDIEMPKMDGISFLEKIMSLRPMPVIMVSTLTQRGADASIRAMEIGAFDTVAKPQRIEHLASIRHELISKIKAAAKANVQARKPVATTALTYSNEAPRQLIAIGASTGGVEALRDLLTVLPANAPPIIISQHMPPIFTKSFAQRLDGLCRISVHEAEHGMKLKAGMACIAPGSHHLTIKSKPGGWLCQLDDGPLVSGHKPSVDVMFESVAAVAGNRAVSAILTGMGKDGARGMLAIREQGGVTIGQNEASCVVYGMPKAAFDCGALSMQVPLSDIAYTLLKHCH